MARTVKQTRSYVSPHRAAQATETRRSIIAAARQLFVRDGWQKTTIAAVAAEAAVSAETIYAAFRTKQALLRAVIEAAVRRADPATPLLQQAGTQAVIGEADLARQIELFATDIAGVLVHVAPLVAVVRAAAETEPKLAALYAELHAGRRRNLRVAAEALVRHGPLRGKPSDDDVTAQLWRLASPELFLLVTRVDGADQQAFAKWLARTLKALFVPDA
jgi:AcrR family transcriptional regulator